MDFPELQQLLKKLDVPDQLLRIASENLKLKLACWHYNDRDILDYIQTLDARPA